MIDYRRLLDRPEKSAQSAAERPIHNTHTNTPMQAVRRRWDSWVIACSHSLICITRPAIYNGHERHFTRTLIYTPAQTVFGIALALLSVNGRLSGERVSRQWLTHTTVSSRLSGFFSVRFSMPWRAFTQHTATFCIQSFLSFCASRTCVVGVTAGYPLCVCALYLSLAVLVCAYAFLLNLHSELKFKSMRWIICLLY